MSAVSSVASSIASGFESRSGPRLVVRGPRQTMFLASACHRGALSMRHRQSAIGAVLLPTSPVACLVAEPVLTGPPDVPAFCPQLSRENWVPKGKVG